MAESVTWIDSRGAEVVLTIASAFELNHQGDRRTSGYREVVVTATRDGAEVNSIGGVAPVTRHPVAVASIGDIGLIADNYNLYLVAEAVVEASIVGHNDALDRHAAEMDAIEDERERLERMMAY